MKNSKSAFNAYENIFVIFWKVDAKPLKSVNKNTDLGGECNQDICILFHINSDEVAASSEFPFSYIRDYSLPTPFLQYSIIPGENPMSPIAICWIYSTYS